MMFQNSGRNLAAVSRLCRAPTTRYAQCIPRRNFKLSVGQMKAVKGWGFAINVLGGAYIGGLLVCAGALYLLYQDANSRQHIPFELSFKNQLTAVKAINKDDALRSPRYALKHYRRLLIELAKKEDPDLQFDEGLPSNKYKAPLLDSETLIYKKSNAFANFYIDIVSRYAKALLAKGELDNAVDTLRAVVDNNDIFYKLGDAERLSQCCRLLAKLTQTDEGREQYLKRSIDMLTSTFSSIKIDEDYRLQEKTKLTDEVLNCLNDLAFTYGRASLNRAYSSKQKQEFLDKSLSIYLANLKTLSSMRNSLLAGEQSQKHYPLFNCDELNLTMSINEIRAHLGEILWSKGYKKNGISWGEEVVDDIYYMNSTSARASTILINVLNNLASMYKDTKNIKGERRCLELKNNLHRFDNQDASWYDSFIGRMCKIIYNKGPLGVIEKALLERFGPPRRLPEIEEFEQEDTE